MIEVSQEFRISDRLHGQICHWNKFQLLFLGKIFPFPLSLPLFHPSLLSLSFPPHSSSLSISPLPFLPPFFHLHLHLFTFSECDFLYLMQTLRHFYLSKPFPELSLLVSNCRKEKGMEYKYSAWRTTVKSESKPCLYLKFDLQLPATSWPESVIPRTTAFFEMENCSHKQLNSQI